MKRLMNCIISAMLFVFATCVTAFASFDSILNEYIKKVEGWEFDATMNLALIIIIGLLGIVIGGLQQVNKTRNIAIIDNLIIVIGVIIPCLIFVNTTLYKVDYNTLNKISHQGRKVLRDVDQLKEAYNLTKNDQEKTFLKGEIMAKLDEIEDMEERTFGLIASMFNLNLSNVLYAQSLTEPSWITKEKKSVSSIYFVGMANDTNLANAKIRSRDDARRKMQAYLEGLTKAAPYKYNYINSVLASAKVEDTYYKKAVTGNYITYQHYTLMSINKRSVSTGIQLYKLPRQL